MSKPWDERRAAVAKTITSHSVDVLGVQEASITRDWDDNDDDIPQWESLRRALAKKGYGHALTGSDGKYEDCGKKDCSADEAAQFGLHIFYKTATLEPMGTGGTVNVDNDWCEWDDRAMVWQVFRTRTTPSTTFLVVNTHLDFEGINERGDFERCRNGQVKNILKALRTSINPQGLPVLFMGDLNSYAYQKPVKTLLKNGFTDTAKVDAPGKNTTFNSFHGFKNPLPRVPGKRIDYIMVDQGHRSQKLGTGREDRSPHRQVQGQGAVRPPSPPGGADVPLPQGSGAQTGRPGSGHANTHGSGHQTSRPGSGTPTDPGLVALRRQFS